MAHLPQGDVKELWQEMGNNRSWQSLHSTLEKHVNKGKGIDNNMVKELLKITDHMKNEKFPDSPEKLGEVLNQRVDKVD